MMTRKYVYSHLLFSGMHTSSM